MTMCVDILKRQEVDYINIYWLYHDRPVIKLEERYFLKYYILNILLKNPYQFSDDMREKDWEREIKRLEHRLKKYSISDAAVHMDSTIEKVMGKEGFGFDSRKQELLRNRKDVLRRIKGTSCQRRKELLIILEDDCFTQNELKHLLVDAKDAYEDITFFSENEKLLDSKAFSYMENEWGVIIGKISHKNELKAFYESVVCVLSHWNDIIMWNSFFKNCYALVREELNNDTQTLIMKANQDGKIWKHLYSGYQYYVQDELIPYQMAVDLLKQYPNNKINSTFIDIYEVKC